MPAPGETTPDADAVLGKAAGGDKDEGLESESALSEVSDGPITLVKIAGLNVHLNGFKEQNSH